MGWYPCELCKGNGWALKPGKGWWHVLLWALHWDMASPSRTPWMQCPHCNGRGYEPPPWTGSRPLPPPPPPKKYA